MPMDLARYLADWKEISLRIRFERAGGLCEWCGAVHGQPHPETGSRVILTVAHLGAAKPDGTQGDKHDKMDVRDENLAALCQKCHLTYDRDEHQVNAAATRRRRRLEAGQIELPLANGKDGAMTNEDWKETTARSLAAQLLDSRVIDIDLWPAADVYEYLEADGYAWMGEEWLRAIPELPDWLRWMASVSDPECPPAGGSVRGAVVGGCVCRSGPCLP